MTRIATHINALSEDDARAALHRCCGSSAWVDAMAARRLFKDDTHLFQAADQVLNGLAKHDLLEAFAAHPRIGERKIEAKAHASTKTWAAAEQSDTASASDETRRAFNEGNRIYEQRFGHVFLICATGRSADEMLSELRRRLNNDPDTELRTAAEQQAMITRLRLKKLVDP